MGVFRQLLIRSGFNSSFKPSGTPPTGVVIESRNSPSDIELSTGTGNSQCDLSYRKTESIAASTNTDYDLAGSLLDEFGNVITFVKVKGIWIKASSSNVNDVRLKPAASNGFVGPFEDNAKYQMIKPGGIWQVYNPAGWTVTAGTGDKLNFANSSSGSAVGFELHIIGSSV